MSFSFAQLNKLSHSLFGVGQEIEDVHRPKTSYELHCRWQEHLHVQLIEHMGKRIEVKDVHQ